MKNNEQTTPLQDKEDDNKYNLIMLDQVYCSCNDFQLYLINAEETRLKHILSYEVKPIENEVKLIDILLGNVETDLDSTTINELRKFFKMRKQIGYNRENEFDYARNSDRNNLYPITTFKNIQLTKNQREDLTNF